MKPTKQRHKILDPKPSVENQPAPNAQYETKIQSGDAVPNVLLASSKSQPKPAPAHHEITRQPEKYWWDAWKPYVELAGVVLLAVYTIVTIMLYCATRQSTDLLKQQLIGSQSALIEFTPILSLPDPVLSANFINQGASMAKSFKASISISRRSIPGNAPIGPVGRKIPIEQALIRPKRSAEGSVIYMENFSSEESAAIKDGREVVTITGSFSYDNGFGEILRQGICSTYVSVNGSSGFMPCEDAESTTKTEAYRKNNSK